MTQSLSATEVKRLNRSWRRRPHPRLALVLEGVQSPFNVGATLRSAAASGVEQVWFAAGATTPANPKVGKTALGSERFLRWAETPTAPEALDAARRAGYTVVGVELAQGAVALHEADLSGDVCLVLGHEDRGLTAATLAACDQLAYVPQLGRIGSLNVAAAAAIACYEARRQAFASRE